MNIYISEEHRQKELDRRKDNHNYVKWLLNEYLTSMLNEVLNDKQEVV